MKTLTCVIKEIKDVCNQYPIMQDRINALKEAGYNNINYVYVKRNMGLFNVIHLPRKKLCRIQIGYTELQKGYPAAWCVDISSIDVVDKVRLPF